MYTLPEIQNEILEVMSLQVLREIAQHLQSSVIYIYIYIIMADEAADIFNKEQLVFCIRSVDDNLAPHEEFIGMHPLVNTSADHIV